MQEEPSNLERRLEELDAELAMINEDSARERHKCIQIQAYLEK